MMLPTSWTPPLRRVGNDFISIPVKVAVVPTTIATRSNFGIGSRFDDNCLPYTPMLAVASTTIAIPSRSGDNEFIPIDLPSKLRLACACVCVFACCVCVLRA